MACSNVRLWKLLRKNEERRLDAFEMKGLRKILWVLWTAKKKTNDWVLNKAGVRKQLLKTVKAKKLAYYDSVSLYKFAIEFAIEWSHHK